MGSKRRREVAHEAKDAPSEPQHGPQTSLPFGVPDGQHESGTAAQPKAKQRSTGSSQDRHDSVPASQQPSKPQAAPVLPWMRVPILIEAGSGVPLQHVAGLDPRLQRAMSAASNSCLHTLELFPVQSVVWSELAGGTSTAHDLCIAAPTGSGKTLAYTLPIVNGLARQPDCARLRTLQALVVLPTRDLAVQVHSVFAQLCPAVGLSLGLAAAQVSLPAEAQELMGNGHHQRSPLTQCRPGLLPGQLPPSLEDESEEAGWGVHMQRVQQGLSGMGQGRGHEGWGAVGQGSVDVLVATPGRLMAHLSHTPGFTLDHLRFLLHAGMGGGTNNCTVSCFCVHGCRNSHVPAFRSPRGVRVLQAFMEKLTVHRSVLVQVPSCCCPTIHPPLELAHVCTSPMIHTHKSFVLRTCQLHEVLCVCVCVCVLYLMLRQVLGSPGCAREQHEVVEFSSHLNSSQRASALEQLCTGRAKVLVASDAMTRGMDVDNVQNIVNYDAPVYAKTYVHRAGRTARAGRSGRVFTLLRDEDVRHFKQMLRKADNTYVRNFKLAPGAADSFKPALEAALKQVQDLLEAEAQDDHKQQSKRTAPTAKQHHH
ncbi:P-loop containing nucleoside triphosphate hydrolase protein [Dunaliella salina]|uniref:P-loop containing nucleoside triphosphate hydrolase protein n=1 Tax=Dunaliella salina TaxID=3046 RepID=A0ABQ7GTS6_DUNSA|nr:P-loop containing nucleoside triphosphate hydrolase protein [Dunaliella salina]|eukprot:KAF5837997.1 P-loop containing nucleoside triphosphate hydrolase protein [Dunaliella salina]